MGLSSFQNLGPQPRPGHGWYRQPGPDRFSLRENRQTPRGFGEIPRHFFSPFLVTRKGKKAWALLYGERQDGMFSGCPRIRHEIRSDRASDARPPSFSARRTRSEPGVPKGAKRSQGSPLLGTPGCQPAFSLGKRQERRHRNIRGYREGARGPRILTGHTSIQKSLFSFLFIYSILKTKLMRRKDHAHLPLSEMRP